MSHRSRLLSYVLGWSVTRRRTDRRWVDGWSVALCMLWNNCVSTYRPNRKISLYCFPRAIGSLVLFLEHNNKYSFVTFKMIKLNNVSIVFPVRNTPSTALSVHGSHLLRSPYVVGHMSHSPSAVGTRAFSRCSRTHTILPCTRITKGGCLV